MVTIRSTNDLILGLIDYFKLVQPDLDSKPGTVARNLFIDAPSNQVALLYDEISKVSTQQSFRLVIGADLDKLAKNFGLLRKSATPSSGIALLTFSSIPAVVNINKNDLITASNGLAFTVLNGLSVNPSLLNFYKSIATKYRNDLDFLGITDQYAVEVTVRATTNGVSGDIAKYSLNRTAIGGVSNVTNVTAFTGGSNQEDDATFRNRILAVFSGSSVGTALGYRNAALATDGVQDAVVIGPGNPLITRDGTIVATDGNGNLVIVSEGSGGKVDVTILGTNLVQNTESFIYHDLSNTNDPTSVKNNVILGQIVADINKTVSQKRIDDLANGVLPIQPVDSLVQVTGSESGANFLPKTVDSLGRVSGNYELIKDTGIYAGSTWGFDAFAWNSDRISDFSEDRIKGNFDGQDTTSFADVLEIPQVKQNIAITNENSTVLTSNRALIQLLHTPSTGVTRVFNVNTGERYTVVSQNPSGTSTINTSGVIQISGNTLPSPNDVLQVDYTWIVNFDQYSDYDGRLLTTNLRPVTDSVDWGYSNLVRSEIVEFDINASSTYFVGNVSMPINSIVSAKQFIEVDGYVSLVTSGVFAGRLSVVLNNLMTSTTSVDSIVFKNTDVELYDTAGDDGSYSNATTVVSIFLEYITTIILPTDTQAQVNDHVTAILNSSDVYNVTGSSGSFSNTLITIPTSNITNSSSTLSLPISNFSSTLGKVNLSVAYIANVQDIYSSNMTVLPSSRVGNGFILDSGVGSNNTNFANISRREFQAVQKDLSNNLYVELNLPIADVSLIAKQVLSIIRLSDGFELWNADNLGTIDSTSSTNYRLILNGHNNPVVGDRALIVYQATDTARFQPFTFENTLIEKDFTTLQYDSVSNNFIVDMHDFVASSGVTFQLLEPNTDTVLSTASDGYILTPFTFPSSAQFSSNSVVFSNLTVQSFTISNATNASPIQITTTSALPTTINTGDGVTIKAVTGNTAANGSFTITIVDSTHFTLNSSTGNGSYISGGVASFGAPLTIIDKKLRIMNDANRNNNNIYDITAYDVSTNRLTISNNFTKISKRQISIMRMLDGQELWSDSGTIDLATNRLLFPATAKATILDKVLITYYNPNNLKQTPTRLALTTTDQVINTGVISINGTTVTKAADIVFTATASGLKQSIFEAIRTALGLASNASLPSNVRLAKVAKLEKVSTASASSNEVLETLVTYNVKGTTIQDNTFYMNDQASNLSFGAFDLLLPSSGKNKLTANQPKIGDKLRITFYYATDNDLENVAFTRNGTLYTNKLFGLVNKVYISSGFGASQSTKLTLSNFNQPITGSRYSAIYDYLAPKPNERITISYNFNKLISDVTFSLENSRPINADVLAKEAVQVLINVTMNIVISSSQISSTQLILQNVKNAITSAINATSLGTTLDASSLVNVAFSVSGVSGARIAHFNKAGSTGQVLSISAQANEFLVANNVIISAVSS